MEIIRGKIPCAKKVVIYGPEGIGKSTFASQFPDPVFIDTEGSTNSMDVARLPKASSWQMILQQVQSLNLRIARAVPLMLPDRLYEILQRHFIGMLVVGEPDSGKTTFLRQIVQSLAGMQRRVCVVDERGEIYPQELSGPDQQLPAVDTLSGIPKERAVQMALRTLSPQVIVLDELGSLAETAALEQGFFSGVDFIASVHAASAEEAVRRPQVKALQQQGMLRVLVLLQGCAEPGRVRQIDEL